MILIREVWKREERKEGERTSQRICIHNPISPPRPPHKKKKKIIILRKKTFNLI
jgi:hypothetical protein